MKADEHKHHIQSAINKASRGVGMLRFLSDYLSRKTFNSLYKFYVRPHFDYGDVIYHIPQKSV